MIGKGLFREHFQPRTCSGKKTTISDQVKGNHTNVVLIDIDSDQVSDVVIIDEPEFVEEKSHRSSMPRKDRKRPQQRVISIDDDDDSDNAYHRGNIIEGSEELDSDASSSKRFPPASGSMRNCVDINVDDCHVIKETVSASNFPKSRRTFIAEAPEIRSRGLDESESGSSEGDCLDCELMEVCEEWEKAWVKRKRRFVDDQAGFDEQASSSSFHSTIYTDANVRNRTAKHAGSPAYSRPSNGKCVKENLSCFSVEENERHVDKNGSTLKNKDNIFKAHPNYACFDEIHANHDGVVSQQSSDSWHNSVSGAEEKSGPTPEDSLFDNPQSLGKSSICNCSEVGLAPDSEVISEQNTLCGVLRGKQDKSSLKENEKPSEACDALHVQDDDVTNSDEREIINKREKLKETDEYKRTIEEEWASRQRELEIQAEEVQRLRKRKKAESMRLLDMQRRQKERIEEVRETQKKDEENMNMKEKLRAEIMKGIHKLETTCVDMASLLQSLGIQVGGGFNPLPHDVHAAYKRALLKFHPDRTSKSDICEQVEAEEKFKLISRMKEKLLSSSCY